MDQPTELAREVAPKSFDTVPAGALAPLDPTESYDLHRAINERRAQVEDTEKLRHLRSL